MRTMVVGVFLVTGCNAQSTSRPPTEDKTTSGESTSPRPTTPPFNGLGNDSSGPPPAHTDEGGDPSTTISVLVTMPEHGHTGSVRGWVTDADGALIAEFELPATWIFLEEATGESGFWPSTSLTDAPTQKPIELPRAGVNAFEIDDVGFWGGCGTCGRGFAGGRVELQVEDSQIVELELGDPTWVS